jgi:hypothetical protein
MLRASVSCTYGQRLRGFNRQVQERDVLLAAVHVAILKGAQPFRQRTLPLAESGVARLLHDGNVDVHGPRDSGVGCRR